MHVNSGILKRIDKMIQETTWRLVHSIACILRPIITTCKSISRSEDELCSIS